MLEQCRIAPPPGSVDDKYKYSLPLTFFDIPWLHFPPLKIFSFYEFSHPKAYFLDTIIPRIKHSLSLTLKHFFPLLGNLVFLTDGSIPEIRFKDGDSVSLTFAECSFDFDHLSGDQQRNDIDFHSLAPQISPASTNFGIVPILAIQVTLFPNSGICTGFTFHHIAADARAFHMFKRLWASINKLGEATLESPGIVLPCYDRTVIKDPIGLRSTFWNHFGKIKHEGSIQPPPSTNNNVRATFILRRAEVEGLKKWVISQIPDLQYVSSFTVICGYAWSCITKAGARILGDHEDVVVGGENELENFAFTVDCRSLLDPPIPDAYFGNCLMGALATTKRMQLIQEDGFLVAVNSIRKAMEERVRSKEGILQGVQNWVRDSKSINLTRLVAVVGTPRVDFYDMDFGLDLGRPKKFEVISRDNYFSLSRCKANQQDFEVGLCFPKAKMDVFAEIFTDGCKGYLHNKSMSPRIQKPSRNFPHVSKL